MVRIAPRLLLACRIVAFLLVALLIIDWVWFEGRNRRWIAPPAMTFLVAYVVISIWTTWRQHFPPRRDPPA